MKIKVLLIDDEQLLAFKDIAEKNRIEIIDGIGSAYKAIEELKKNHKNYDAIILDGIFFLNEETTNSEQDKTPLIKVIKYIDKELGSRIPWFILSGNIAFNKDVKEDLKSYVENDFSEKIYDKLNKKDLQDLCDNIKRCVENKISFKIKKQYQQAFDSYDELFIGSREFEECKKALLDILTNISEPKYDFDYLNYYPKLRIIIELIFWKAHKFGLIPDIVLKNDKINLTYSSLLLSGIVLDVDGTKHNLSKTHFVEIIRTSVKEILSIVNHKSHANGENTSKNKKLFEFEQRVKNPHLLYKMTFEILDIIIWFNSYLKDNNDYEINKSYWIQSEIKSFYKKD